MFQSANPNCRATISRHSLWEREVSGCQDVSKRLRHRFGVFVGTHEPDPPRTANHGRSALALLIRSPLGQGSEIQTWMHSPYPRKGGASGRLLPGLEPTYSGEKITVNRQAKRVLPRSATRVYALGQQASRVSAFDRVTTTPDWSAAGRFESECNSHLALGRSRRRCQALPG